MDILHVKYQKAGVMFFPRCANGLSGVSVIVRKYPSIQITFRRGGLPRSAQKGENYNTNVAWTSYGALWGLKSPVSRLFAQPFIQSHNNQEIMKAPRHWPLWGESTGGFPSQRASNAENDSIWWRHHVVSNESLSWHANVRLLHSPNLVDCKCGMGFLPDT